jgi:hypothetical protein
MALFGNCVIYVSGILLAHNTTIDTELVSDDQEVMTVPLGFAGLSPSPDVRRITCANVIPSAGFDYDVEGAKLNRTEVEIKLQQVGSGKSCITKGFITGVPQSFGVGQTSTINFTFVGTPIKFE